ncbi:hypothetical protein AFR_39205 [Actinoplanes friuliensis DSM 7358]|uniref:Uncharacterized protein n=1 Tax=Actinoplanes friuliensis DSM 7358 TaxID=1246995 RepID=U5WDL7_9ACTN|nr:hypothetical protein AFR_39205 [Actinoplanes friuliensis DSM 7358]
MGNVQSATEVEDDDEEAPGLWESFGAALRLIVGWFSIAIGILNLLVELDRGSAADGAYLLFHAMLLVGGVLMVSLAWIAARPGVAGWSAGGGVLAAGMLASGVPASDALCCLSAYAVRHGYPFSFAARDADGGRWHVDSQHLLADLLFWGYAGLIVLVVVALARRATHHHEARE